MEPRAVALSQGTTNPGWKLAMWVVQGATVPIILQDGLGHVIFKNDAAARLTGWASGEEMVGTLPGEVVLHFVIFDQVARPMP